MSGLYVVQFTDRVKIGRAGHLRDRLRAHLRAGAVAFVGFPGAPTFLESPALRIARTEAVQIGRSESFTGLSLQRGADIVAAVLDQRGEAATRHLVRSEDWRE